MSAICGIWFHRDGRPARPELGRIDRALAAFGRDRAATWDGGAIALAARLFRTVPEDRFDRQPLVGGGDRFVLVADLRLDNRPVLAAALGLDAERAATMADADLLLAGWERWGGEVVHHLTGRFAFAVFDREERRLFLARDPLGMEQLYFHLGDGWFAFASRPRALLALPEVPLGPDLSRIADHLVNLPDLGNRSFFAGVSRLGPGQRAWLDADGGWRIERYWRPEDIPVLSLADPRGYADGLREALDRAVAAQLRAIGPVGSMLSSGYDSTIVTATAARQLAARGEGLLAFTHVPHPDFAGPVPAGRHGNEGPLAAEVARLHPNITHHLLPNPQVGLARVMDRLNGIGSFPSPQVVHLWMYDLYGRAAAMGVRTLLHGSLGNVTLSYHGAEAPAELLAAGRFGALLRHLRGRRRAGASVPHLAARTLAPFLSLRVWQAVQRLSGRLPLGLTDWSAIAPQRLDDAEFRARLAAAGLEDGDRPQRDGRTARLQMTRLLEAGPLLDDCQETVGIDYRDPTADLDLFRFSLSIPTEVFAAGGRSRSLYRAAFQDDLPAAVLDAPTRGLQIADLSMMLARNRADLIDDLERSLGSSRVASTIAFDEALAVARALPTDAPATAAVDWRSMGKLVRAHAAADFIRRTAGENG